MTETAGGGGNKPFEFFGISPDACLVEQDRLAHELDALSDQEAHETLGALISILHQMRRAKAGLGSPMALDEEEVFFRSFEDFIEDLDLAGADQLKMDYLALERLFNR